SLTAGALTLTGDTGDHDFSMSALDAKTFQLKAAAGTLFHMDGTADTDTLQFTSSIKSVTATLGDGNDHLSILGLNIAGDVTIGGGLGTNSVDFNAVTIKGGLKITGGSGADSI